MKLVGKNFEDLVVNNESDVFIKFYAPWCGHCKAMAEDWAKLADEYADDKSMVIAEFDATANDTREFSKDFFSAAILRLKYLKFKLNLINANIQLWKDSIIQVSQLCSGSQLETRATQLNMKELAQLKNGKSTFPRTNLVYHVTSYNLF